MSKFAQAGDFCPNEVCPDYGKLQSDQQPNILKFGPTPAGRQRHKGKTCGKTVTETKGTLFYRRHPSEAEIIDTLAHIAEGNRRSSLVRTTGAKEDPRIAWVRAAGQHAEAIEEVLLAEYQLRRGQIDGLWAYVGNKGEKNYPETDESGQFWRATSLSGIPAGAWPAGLPEPKPKQPSRCSKP